MASQITGVSIVCSTVGSGTDQRKHQSSVSLTFVRGIYPPPVNSPHKRPVMRKMFPFYDAIMTYSITSRLPTVVPAPNTRDHQQPPHRQHKTKHFLWLSTWIDFNSSMAEQLHQDWCVELRIYSQTSTALPGMDKCFHPTLYDGCNYLSMLVESVQTSCNDDISWHFRN